MAIPYKGRNMVEAKDLLLFTVDLEARRISRDFSLDTGVFLCLED
jgi:hypothetical protein